MMELWFKPYPFEKFIITIVSPSTIEETLDLIPPETTITLDGVLGNNGWYISDVNLILTATDDHSGVALTEFSIDGASWTPYTEPFTITKEGITTVYYRSTDGADNMEVTKEETIKIDKTAPTTTAIPSGTEGLNEWYVSNVTITLTATDDISGLAYTEYNINSAGWQTYTGIFTLTDEGTSTIEYRSFDNAGNGEDLQTLIIKIDKTAPTTTLTIEPYYVDELGNIHVISKSEFTLIATDSYSEVSETYYRINDGNWVLYMNPFNLIGSSGNYTINYYSVDVHGNEETLKTTKVILDEDFSGWGLLRIERKFYIGEAKLYLSPESMRIEVKGQSASWNITNYWAIGKLEFYYGEGDLGKIRVIIIQGRTRTYAIAVGKGVVFHGYSQ